MATEELYQALKDADVARIAGHERIEVEYQAALKDAWYAWHKEDVLKDNPISENKEEPGT